MKDFGKTPIPALAQPASRHGGGWFDRRTPGIA